MVIILIKKKVAEKVQCLHRKLMVKGKCKGTVLCRIGGVWKRCPCRGEIGRTGRVVELGRNSLWTISYFHHLASNAFFLSDNRYLPCNATTTVD